MSFLTIEGVSEERLEVRRSVFICSAKGVADFDEGLAFAKAIGKRYSDATHNCYAINCLDGQKFSDDGEPQGTAGQPIMQTVKKLNLNNVCCVVTRYFGGIKLGAGGLVSAYTEAAAKALERAEKVEVFESVYGEITADYNCYKGVSGCISRLGKVIEAEFSEGAKIKFAAPKERWERLKAELTEITAGRSEIIPINTGLEKYNGRN